MSLRAPRPAASGRLLDALRALRATLGEMIGIRADLLALELREELERRKRMLVVAVLALALLHTALLLAALLVAVAFWDTHRLSALGAMATVCLACGAGALLELRRRFAAGPKPFAGTLAELQRDLAQWSARP